MGFWRCLLPFAYRNQSLLAFRCITRFQISQVNNSIADERYSGVDNRDNRDSNILDKQVAYLIASNNSFGNDSKDDFTEHDFSERNIIVIMKINAKLDSPVM